METIKTSNGVVLRLKPVAQSAITRLIEQLDKPEVPKFQLEDGTWEENPNDPDWANAMDLYSTDVMSTVQTAYIQLGTEVVQVPDTMAGVDSEDWIDELQYAGLRFYRGADGEEKRKGDIDISTPYKRQVEWKRLVAMNGVPMREMVQGIARLSGTLEAEVIRAYAWFQTRTKRGGPLFDTTEELSVNGNNGSAANTGNGVTTGGNAGVEAQHDSVAPMAGARPRF